jgi:predicted RNA-binding protein with PUA-like domain
VAFWLLKTEPDCYSWDNLTRDKKTAWDGVTNALALKHIRNMAKGDLALIYHTGDERAAIGTAEVVSAPYPDPKAEDERHVVVDVKPRQKLAQPVTLSDIKADPAFAGWDLLRISRLSVVPVPEKLWDHLLDLAKPGSSEGPVAASKPRPTARRKKS